MLSTVKNTSPLQYPAGRNPGFSSTHLAASTPRFSAVASGNGAFVSLLDNGVGTLQAGTPAAAIDPVMGPVTNMGNLGQINYPTRSVTTEAIYTMAGILAFTSFTGNQWLFSNGASAGTDFLIGSASVGFEFFNGSFAVSNISLVANVPYFVIGSISAATANFLVMNLNTGAIRTVSVAGLAVSAPSGAYIVGSNPISVGASNKIAAVMYSVGHLLSIAEMREWAQDPWTYWFPRKSDQIMSIAVRGVVAPVLAGRQNLAMM